MDKRTLEKRAARRKLDQEIKDKKLKEQQDTANEIVRSAKFFRLFIQDPRYAKYSELLNRRKELFTYQLIWLEEPDPSKNGMKSEGLRKEIHFIEQLLTAPDNFLKGEEHIRKYTPHLIKEEDDIGEEKETSKQ